VVVFWDDLEAAKHEVAKSLLIMNGVIIAGAAVASYILAGRSLEPLELAMEKQRRFIGDASHELRTPIAAMRTSVEVILRAKNNTKEDLRVALAEAREEIVNLQELTDSLLDFAKYGEGELAFEDFQLKPSFLKVLRRIRPLAREKGIKVIQNVKEVELQAHQDSIEQLLSILLDNAVKYSPKNSKVVVTMEKKKSDVLINVMNTGPGISKKDRKRIFDRFYRADSARAKEKNNGFGLGLSLARRIVDSHNGSIDVKNKKGLGTEVVVKLPSG
jgi:signal transduction histidine kinase